MILAAILLCSALGAQSPPTPPAPIVRRPPAFPERPPADPAVVERGKALYGVHCAFCHGVDARGGSGGINLIRASMVLNDKNGELIGQAVREGRTGMPKFDLSDAQLSDMAAFIHSFKVGGYDVSRMTPTTIVTGDAKLGAAYFQKTCSGCHTVAAGGNNSLQGIATRITDPKMLQQTWLMPGSGGRGGAASRTTPVTVTVTENGKSYNGRLVRIDDFVVSLAEADGYQRSFARNGDIPKVELHDPLAGHRKLIPTYQDEDIHNLTAYLVTVK
ncbi:c-type cytochrome [Bryobacter aggregatus]|uniref:c-type cytochrome n=1 Tax=Bryobacter aggregatus TaxID=360054 RepID=UPI00068CF838|nr:c-type cytochrome [Bryobacter aggregatus]